MRVYAATLELANVGAAQTLCEIVAGTGKPLRIISVLVTQYNQDTSEQVQIAIDRTTAVGTGTDVTPEPLDSGDAAASWRLRHSHTTEPTWGGRLHLEGVSSLAGFHYQPRPDTEILVPAGGSIGVRLLDAPTNALNLLVTVVAAERD